MLEEMEVQSKLSKSDQMEEQTTENLLYLRFKHCSTVHWVGCCSPLTFLSSALNLWRESTFHAHLVTKHSVLVTLMETHSISLIPVGLTFKMVMCDQPKRHHKGKFLKKEHILHLHFSLRQNLSDMKVHSTCGLSSRLTLAGGGGGRGGEDEGGVLVTTCSGPPCGFTV